MSPLCGQSDRRRLVAGIVVVTLVALAGCTGSTGPDHVVCLSCETAEHAALSPSEEETVERATVEVAVDETGDSRWSIRIQFDNASEDALELATVRIGTALNEGSFTTSHPHGASSLHGAAVSDVEMRPDATNDSLGVTYTVPDVGRRTVGGTLLVHYFHAQHERRMGAPALGADEVRLYGPDQWEPTTVPPNATRGDDGAVVWSGRETQIGENSYVTFASDRTPVTRATGSLGIAVDLVAWRGLESVFASAIPVLLLVASSGALVAARQPVRGRSGLLDDGSVRSATAPLVASLGLVLAAGIGVAILLPVSMGVYELLWYGFVAALGCYAALGVAASREHWAAWPIVASLGLIPVVSTVLYVFSAAGSVPWDTVAYVTAFWSVVTVVTGGVLFVLVRAATDRFG